MLILRNVKYTFKFAAGQLKNSQYFNTKNYQSSMLSILYKNHVSSISTSSILAREHSVKGWKFKARDGEIPKKLPHDACEEGTEAVPHSVLMSELQKCLSVSSQIETFCSMLSLTSEDIENRRAFCKSLEEALSLYFSNFKVTLFGSSTNGLGFKGCDADICLNTFNNEDFVVLKDVPSLSSVSNGTVSKETLSRMTPKYTLHFVSRIIRGHCPDVNKSIVYINARCPILRFYNSKYDVFCDFSCENKFSVRNTMLLQLLGTLDDRFSMIAKIIRYWGKQGGFVGDIDKFNSYSFSLLVVHFLQTRHSAVLPSIQEIIEKSEYIQSGNIDHTFLLLKDVKKFSPSQNTQTLEELLREFFFYFLTFDFSRVITIFSSSSVAKSTFTYKPKETGKNSFEFGAVNIQDPFRHNFNVSAGALYKSCKDFLHSVLKASQAFQDDTLWMPTSQNWGLCSLFPAYNQPHHQRHEQNHNLSYTIDLPYISDYPKKLKSILEHALLFECTEFQTKDSNFEDGHKLLLKLDCKACHKTWQGRDFVAITESSDSCVLNKEHLISKELVDKSKVKKQVLCEFKCMCFEVNDKGTSRLVVSLDFMQSKFPPIVAIFLKEFIPHILKKL